MSTDIPSNVTGDTLSRRQFIDRAAVVTGGVAVTLAVAGCAGGAAGGVATASSAPAPTSDWPTYRVALADAPELSKVGGVLRVKQEDFVALADAPELSEAGGVLRVKQEDFVALADAPELSEAGGELRVKQQDIDFFVVRQSDDAVIALNNVCSHKNCATKYDAAKNDFACPCHKSRFDLEGVPHGGPAKDPLTRYPASLVDGVVTVTLQI
jgi:Rieske Fe-S protein